MTQFPFIVKLTLSIVMLSMAVGSVCAQNGKTEGTDAPKPLEYRRVFVPSGRPDLWPTQDERYIPVPQEEFQKLLNTANRDVKASLFVSPEVKVTAADYDAVLETSLEVGSEEETKQYSLSGHARLQVVASTKGTSRQSFLTLGPLGMSVKNIAWNEGKQPVEVGVDKYGRLIAPVDRSGVLQFDFTARNRSTKPGELLFDLSLPPSTRSTVLLSLDPTWTVSVPSGLLLSRDASEKPESSTPKQIRWTVAPTLDGKLRLLLMKKEDPSALPEIPDVRESLVYEFSAQGLELRGVLHLAANGAMLPERLRIGLEKPLTLVSARLESLPIKWTLESEEKDRTIISLELPRSRPRSVTLRLKAACAIVEKDDWQLPRIVPKKVFWRSGDMTMLVTAPLSIGKLIPLGCVRTKAGELPDHKGRSIELTPFRPDATATISLGWEKHLPTLSSGTVAELSGVGTSVTQTLLFTASQEDRFELGATINSGWIIDSVKSSPSALVADWRVESHSKKSNGKLIVRLATALSKSHGPLRLTLSARRLESPLGKKLGVRGLTPVEFDDVSQENRLTAITTVDPYSVAYRGEEYVDSVSISNLTTEQVALFPQSPSGKLFHDNARAARLEIILQEQKPVYAATVETIVTLTEEKLIESYRFRCVPEASHIDRLLIHFSGERERETGAEREKGKLQFFPKPMSQTPTSSQHDTSEEKTLQTLSPKSFSAVKLTPADQASVGMSSGGETWEITLKTPQSEPFEFYAARSLTCANIRSWARPTRNRKGDGAGSKKTQGQTPLLTVCPSLAAMPEAVEHHASLQIETTDASTLLVKNLRLDPIAITPTDPLKIQNLRAAFYYETTDALAHSSDPSICLTIGKSDRTSLMAWQCLLQTEYGSNGKVKATARYDLENQGESRLRLLIPKGTPPLTVIDVSLDGKHVGWTPEYAAETMALSRKELALKKESLDSDSDFRLVAMSIALPRTKRFPSVTINYSYRNDSFGISMRRSLLAPKPECEVISVDWQLLLPPGYELFDYVDINNMVLPERSDLASKISPRATLCCRTRLFGPLGRPASDRPFNPLSLDSWYGLFDVFDRKAWGAESNEEPLAKNLSENYRKSSYGQRHFEQKSGFRTGSQAAPGFTVEDYPDWNLYQIHYNSLDRTSSIRMVHRDSLEVFRWTAFLITIAGAIWPWSARWIRRLPVAVLAALAAIFLPPLTSCLASGFLMGVLVALLAGWLLERGNGRSYFRRTAMPDGPGGTVSAMASRSRFTSTNKSTATSPVATPRKTDPVADKEREFSTGTSIEIGKTIDDGASSSAQSPQQKSPPPPRPGGSTIIRRTTMLWLLTASLLLSGSARGLDMLPLSGPLGVSPSAPELRVESPDAKNLNAADPSVSEVKETPPASRPESAPLQWPILIPTGQKEPTSSIVDPMLYLPEPFFRSLEQLARQQANDRDLWLLKDATLRVVLDRAASSNTIEPTFLFLTVQASVFSANVEVQLPLKKGEVQLKENGSLLDGQPVSPRWAEDGLSLLIPIAGKGTHQLEITLIPLPKSNTTRWNAKKHRDESGFQIDLPRLPQTQLELTHPADMPRPRIEDQISLTNESSTTTRAILSPEGRLAIWWPGDISSGPSDQLPEFEELLLLDVTSSAVVLQATWKLISDELTASPQENYSNRTLNQLRDITLSVDPQLRLLELTGGFTLRSIAGSPDKRHLRWNKKTDPPKQVHAKFALEKVSGIGQFHAPTLRVDGVRSIRHWFAVRVAPNLQYEVDLPKLSPQSVSPPKTTEPGEKEKRVSPAASSITPDEFMAVWQEELTAEPEGSSLVPIEESQGQNTSESRSENPTFVQNGAGRRTISGSFRIDSKVPSFVVADGADQTWSFRTEPKSIDTKVVHQTLRVSFGETSTSVRFDAEWSSGSCDMPEPSLRVPANFKVLSVVLIDDGVRQSVPWSGTEEGFVHLATGLLPPKSRTIRMEGMLEAIDVSKPVVLPVISLVGAEDVPVYLGIYRKTDVLVSLDWNQLPVNSELPTHVSNGWFQGRLVYWLKQKPLDKPAVKVRITPNRPSIRARQVVTISSADDANAKSLASESDKESTLTERQEMVADFELIPTEGVIDEIAIFVPQSVVGPFRTTPIIPLVRSHETEKGRTIIFRPKEPIVKRQRFQLSSPMAAGESRVPDVKLCGVDDLKRYVVLPTKTKHGERRRWQTRLLNREDDPAILDNLVSIAKKAQLYLVVGRQWLAIASTSKVAKQSPTVSLADIQVRWQEDGSYLASVVFDLKPSGNKSCQLIVPHGLTLLDTRIAGIPTSTIEVISNKKKPTPAVTNVKGPDAQETTYKIYFTSKTLPQRIEVLYQNSLNESDTEQLSASLSGIVQKHFRTPSLNVEIQQTRWTVQGPDAYVIKSQFDPLEKDGELSTLVEEEKRKDAVPVASLTPFLMPQASSGDLVQWTTEGFKGELITLWQSQIPNPLATQMPTAFLLLLIGILTLIRPVRTLFGTLPYRFRAAFSVIAASRYFDGTRFARRFAKNRCGAGVTPEVEVPKNLCGISLYRYRPLFGIAVGLFWWLFLTPSVLGWAIIVTFLVVAYRLRNARPQDDSTVIRIG